MSGLALFTLFHVILSLIGIVAGLIALNRWIHGDRAARMTAIFLGTTLATTVTGFLFPFHGFTPAIAVGILTTILLLVAIFAYYRLGLSGRSRPVFVACAVASLYFNVFVLIVQAFQKVPPLHALAPAGNEPPFAITQGLVLVVFLLLGYLALGRFRPGLPV
jgi:hypothetical protein